MHVEVDSDTELPHFFIDKSVHIITDQSTSDGDNIHIWADDKGMRIEVFSKDGENTDEPVFEAEMTHEQWVEWFKERAGTA